MMGAGTWKQISQKPLGWLTSEDLQTNLTLPKQSLYILWKEIAPIGCKLNGKDSMGCSSLRKGKPNCGTAFSQ